MIENIMGAKMTNAQHRILNTVMSISLLVIFILFAASTEEKLETCSDMLYEHITTQVAPEGLYDD